MNGDDGKDAPEWPIRRERTEKEHTRAAAPEPRTTERRTSGRGITPILLALGGLLLLLLLLWLFTGNRSADQDKLIGNEARNEEAAADPEELCASKSTYDLVKRELFRRAAQVRGSDQAAFDQLSAHAVLRVENPVLESEDEDSGAVNCAGSLSLDLPPGVAVVGGRRTLSADVEYSLRAAADDSGNVVLLRNAEAIVTPLATLARVAQAPAQDVPDPAAQEPVPEPLGPGEVPPAAPPQPAQPSAPAPEPEPQASSGSARPSFNCANARTRGEKAVCSDAGLASLDRQMSSQFFAALSRADPGERALLQRTRSRFISYRDSCRSDACIADAYRGRMREISDIMAGRWQPR